jgi:hypothetical protein
MASCRRRIPLRRQSLQRGSEFAAQGLAFRQVLLLLLDHLGRGFGDEGVVAQFHFRLGDLVVDLADLALQAVAFLGQVDDPGQGASTYEIHSIVEPND